MDIICFIGDHFVIICYRLPTVIRVRVDRTPRSCALVLYVCVSNINSNRKKPNAAPLDHASLLSQYHVICKSPNIEQKAPPRGARDPRSTGTRYPAKFFLPRPSAGAPFHGEHVLFVHVHECRRQQRYKPPSLWCEFFKYNSREALINIDKLLVRLLQRMFSLCLATRRCDITIWGAAFFCCTVTGKVFALTPDT